MVAIWRAWTHTLRSAIIDSSHHMAEDAPDELTDQLVGFLAAEVQ